jgi:hypothetical protein
MLGPEAGIGHRIIDFPDLETLKNALLVGHLSEYPFAGLSDSPSYGG